MAYISISWFLVKKTEQVGIERFIIMFSVAGNPPSKEPDIPKQLGSKFSSFSAYPIIEREKLGDSSGSCEAFSISV